MAWFWLELAVCFAIRELLRVIVCTRTRTFKTGEFSHENRKKQIRSEAQPFLVCFRIAKGVHSSWK